jgi:hypothetical protein
VYLTLTYRGNCVLCIDLNPLLSDMNSSGFCLINNVAIGAAYAKARYGRSSSSSSSSSDAKLVNGSARAVNGAAITTKHEPRVSRIAIVDFDIHVSAAIDAYCLHTAHQQPRSLRIVRVSGSHLLAHVQLYIYYMHVQRATTLTASMHAYCGSSLISFFTILEHCFCLSICTTQLSTAMAQRR